MGSLSRNACLSTLEEKKEHEHMACVDDHGDDDFGDDAVGGDNEEKDGDNYTDDEYDDDEEEMTRTMIITLIMTSTIIRRGARWTHWTSFAKKRKEKKKQPRNATLSCRMQQRLPRRVST